MEYFSPLHTKYDILDSTSMYKETITPRRNWHLRRITAVIDVNPREVKFYAEVIICQW